MAQKSESPAILVSRFSALGDIALTIPSLYEACRANSGYRFYMLTRKHPSGMFVNPPDNLTVVTVDLDNYKGFRGMWKLADSLIRRYDISVYVDLHDVVRTKLLRLFMRLRGVRVRHVEKGRGEKRALTRQHNKIVVPLKSTVDRYNDAFRRAGINREDTFKGVYGEGRGDEALFAAASQPKREGERWIAMAPFARHRGKMYPLHHLERVIEHYDAKPGIKIFVLGAGAEESAKLQAIADKYGSVVNVAAANLGMEGEISLLSHCDVMLSMDSANMHIASLVGLRTVSIWGATHPFCGFMGWRQKMEDAVQLEMTCRPCSVYGNKPCLRGDYHCLEGITPQMVINVVGV